MSLENEPAHSKEAMTSSILSDASKQHTHVRKDDGFADLLVTKSHSLHVRFSLRNLINAVTSTMLMAVFERLLEEDADVPTAQFILQRQNVKPASDSTFTVTEFAEKLMYDGDRRVDIYLERVLRERDLATALQALGRASARLLSRGVLEGQIQRIGEGILDDLDDAKSLGSHLIVLREIVEELNQSIAAINTRRESCSSQRAFLQTRLSEDSSNAAQNQSAPKSKWWQPLQQQFSNIQKRFNRPKASSNVSTMPRRARAGEKQLLETELRLRSLDAELSVLVSLVTFLNREITVDEAAIDTLRAELQKISNSAQEFEGFRDYSVAGGEMLLNDGVLTEAVTSYTFGDGADIASQITILSERCGDLIAKAQGEVTPSVLTDMQQIVREVVSELLNRLTISDVIAALHRSDENFQNKLREAFRITASMDFLAVGYENYLGLQKFISASYALSTAPLSNNETKSVLDHIFDTLQIEVATSHDISDIESLRFHVNYFSIPLTALQFFEASKPAFENVKEDARFNIHPDLYL